MIQTLHLDHNITKLYIVYWPFIITLKRIYLRPAPKAVTTSKIFIKSLTELLIIELSCTTHGSPFIDGIDVHLQ